MKKKSLKLSILLILLFVFGFNRNANCQVPFQATGIKIGEVSRHSAIIWTRLTKNAERNIGSIPFKMIKGKKSKENPEHFIYSEPQIPEGHSLDEMQNVVPGSEGEVRVQYWVKGKNDATLKSTPWEKVDPEKDFTHQFSLKDLEPWTDYELVTECRKDENSPVSEEGNILGNFKTPPEADDAEPLKFSIITCQAYYQRDDSLNGHKIYNVLNGFNPDFFVMTGDIVYYDRLGPVATSKELARFKWNRMYSLPFQREFHKHVSSYFEKDDHDTWQDDCWPTMKNDRMRDFTFKDGQEIFLEQVPITKQTYRTFRWGKDLQFWLVEGRDFRSPNTMPDGPEKTIWGNEQKEWFKKTVQESDATFKILISPTPLVGPDRESKNDNLANEGFKYEGDELRQFISRQKNMFVVTGDRHWQYVSVDPLTGLKEFATGATTDQHAGGFTMDQREPMQLYLNIVGGFLWGTIERKDGKPVLTFRHYSVDGKILHEETMIADQRK
jgi:alkaline phosphatase D